MIHISGQIWQCIDVRVMKEDFYHACYGNEKVRTRMNAIDLKNAFDGNDDYFTVLLLRLIAKSDSGRREKFRLGFPVEVKAVEIFKGDCPYVNADHNGVDWDEIARRATSEIG